MEQQTNTLNAIDWVRATKDMKITAYVPISTEVQPFTKRAFEEALKKVSRKVNKNRLQPAQG
jgi:hypothetical protein